MAALSVLEGTLSLAPGATCHTDAMTSPIKRFRPHLRKARQNPYLRTALGLCATLPALGQFDASFFVSLAVGCGTGYIVASWAWKPREMQRDRENYARSLLTRIAKSLIEGVADVRKAHPDSTFRLNIHTDPAEGLVVEHELTVPK